VAQEGRGVAGRDADRTRRHHGSPAGRGRDPLIAGAALGFGILIEGLQALTPTRSAEFGDVLAEVVGIAVAIGLARAGLGGWALRVERLLGLAPR